MLDYEQFNFSSEFVGLCQVQLKLLTHNFSAQECAIYLAEKSQTQEPKLTPILAYPPLSTDPNHRFLPALPTIEPSKVDSNLEQQQMIDLSSHSHSPHQLLIPLLYQDTMMGLLTVNREQSPWTQAEVLQIKEIAYTITLARILEQKQQMTAQQLSRQQQLQTVENEHLHDFLHQLRNPLTALRTFAKLLLKRIVSEDQNHGIVGSIIRESDRLKDLIQDFSEDWERLNDYLDLMLPESKSTSFFLTDSIKKLEPTDLGQLIEPLIVGITEIAKEKDIEIIHKIEPDLPLVFTNPKALIEVLNNLLDNSVKYTPKGGKVCLEIGTQKSHTTEKKLVIEISDTGYGIPYQDQQHIFQRHYRGVQSEGDIAGTGLGLAIVKELCDQMQIKIELFSPSFWLENQQLNGTTFQLSVPLSS